MEGNGRRGQKRKPSQPSDERSMAQTMTPRRHADIHVRRLQVFKIPEEKVRPAKYFQDCVACCTAMLIDWALPMNSLQERQMTPYWRQPFQSAVLFKGNTILL